MLANVGELVFSGSVLLAIPVAIAAGFLSFVSPCVLPLVPGYFSYITGLSNAELNAENMGLRQRSRIMIATAGFVAGFSLLFVSYGLAFGQLGNWFLTHERIVSMVLGVLVIVMGAGYLGWIPAMNQDFRPRFRLKDGVWTAPLLGFLFGLGWSPCAGPTLGAVQSLALLEGSALRGAVLSLAYCLGLGLPFLIIAFAYRRSLVATQFLRRHSQLITRIGGAFLIAIGFAMVTGMWAEVTAVLRTWAADFGVIL
jgi:cytochrome c-type biogenesis protein